MAIPTDLPVWDTNETRTAPPPSEIQDDGWTVSEAGIPDNPSMEYDNWWKNNVYKWVERFDNVTAGVNTIVDLLSFPETEDETTVNVRGYNSSNDGGGGLFNWDSTTDKSTANGGTIIDPSVSLALQGTGSGLGCWVREKSDPIDIRWFGAACDGLTDDIAAINKALALSEYIYMPDETIYVSAMPNFDHHIIVGKPVIKFPTGVITSTTTSLIGSEYTKFLGNSSSLTFSSAGSVTGSTGAWSMDIVVADATEVTAGMFLKIRATSGTGTHEVFQGAWKISNVVSNTITITMTHQNASFPTASLTDATLVVIQTVLQFDAQNGLVLYGGNYETDGIVYEEINAVYKDGTKPMIIGLRQNASDNGISNAAVLARSDTAFYGGGNHGIVVGGTSFLEMEGGVCACGNLQDGFHVSETAQISGKFCIASGNGESGAQSEMNADAEIYGIIACGNGLHGVETIGGNFGIAQSTTLCSYNIASGVQCQDDGTVRAASITCSFNDVGIKCETGGDVFASNSICDNNTSEGYFATKKSYIEAEDSTSTNNGVGFRSERDSRIDALGTLTVSGNTTDYQADLGGLISFAGGSTFPSALEQWESFATSPAFVGVTVTTENNTGKYFRTGKIVNWKITMDYSGLDTADISAVVISEMPVPMIGRFGGIEFSIRSSTGIIMAATDTYQANYNTTSDRILFVNSAGTLMTYNGGQIQASGIIEISGWYEVA